MLYFDYKARARLSFLALMMLTACASPVRGMAPAQVSQLSDLQLCRLSVGYRYEPNTEAEIARRGLMCSGEAVQCMEQGVAQHAPAFGFCVAAMRAQALAAAATYQDQARRDYALREYGDEANARHLFVWQ